MEGGFQHQRPARPQQLAGELEATGLTAAIDDDIEPAIPLGWGVEGGNAAPPQNRQLAGMTTDDMQIAARQLEDLSHEQTKLAIADDRHTLARLDMHTVGDLQRRRQRFDEHR